MSKPYNIEGLQGKSMGREDTSATAAAGLWRHPESGEEAVTLEDPLFGNPQSEAFKRLGFVRVGDTPEGYVKDINAAAPVSGIDPDSQKGIMARLNELEATNKRLEAELAKNTAETLASTDQTTLSAEQARADAQAQADLRPGVLAEAPVETPVEKKLSEMNKTDLLVIVEAEGVVGVTEENTKKEIVAAIESKRKESENE